MRASCTPVVLLLAVGLTVHLGVHFVQPGLPMTWSYAHLDRHPALPWVGAALLVALPLVTTLVWRLPAANRPLGRLGWRTVAATMCGEFVLLALGVTHPTPPAWFDAAYFVKWVSEGAWYRNVRWYLTVWFLSKLAALVRPWIQPVTFIRGANTLLAATALAALAGCARLLGHTRGEAAAITLLAWSAFGVLQITLGYTDVYPVALLVTALYVWTALGVLAGQRHPVWPFLLAAAGPFWYIGLVLLGPSLLVIAWVTARRPGGWSRLAVAGAVSVAVAGVATVPGFGYPFAWRAFLAKVATQASWGYRPGWSGDTLPLSFMLSTVHAAEVGHTLLLVDGVGVLLLLVAGGWVVARRRWDERAAFLSLLVLSYLAYVIAMDPVFGPFADWDHFSYGAAATSVLGAYVFVLWGRECPRPFRVLLGVALAAAGVHLLARLNGLDVNLWGHLDESPFHLGVPDPSNARAPGSGS